MNAQMTPVATIEQYQAYLGDLANIGSRYATANGFYLSVISALLGILFVMTPAEGMADLQNILRLAVPLFAIGLCFVWRQTISFYRSLFTAKFEVLREMEVSASLFPAYQREKTLFSGSSWLLRNEARIPLYLALPFVVIFFSTCWQLLKPV